MRIGGDIVALLGPPLIVGLSFIALAVLPAAIVSVLVAWTLASVPAGIAIGHLSLNGD